MAFQIEELLRLLQDSEDRFTLDWIATKTNKAVRSIVNYKNGKATPKPNHAEDILNRLAPTLVNTCGLPWSLAAQHHVNEIIALERNGQTEALERVHDFAVRTYVKQLTSLDPKAIRSEELQADADMWGHAVVAYFYLRSVWMHTDDHKRSALTAEWEQVIVIFKALLSTKGDARWAQILRNKIASAEFAILWNGLDPKTDARHSEDVKKKLAELDVYNIFIAYSDFVPTAREAPWSATCIASRFEERGKYPDLFARLATADPSFQSWESIQTLKQKDRDFDEDLDDFLNWIDANQQDLFQKGAA
jgi:hypothetical protein